MVSLSKKPKLCISTCGTTTNLLTETGSHLSNWAPKHAIILCWLVSAKFWAYTEKHMLWYPIFTLKLIHNSQCSLHNIEFMLIKRFFGLHNRFLWALGKENILYTQTVHRRSIVCIFGIKNFCFKANWGIRRHNIRKIPQGYERNRKISAKSCVKGY